MSGAVLAGELDISRQAVWKHIQTLRQTGLEIEAGDGSGYCLARPVQMLEAAVIGEAVAESGLRQPPHITVLKGTNSTNDWLSERARRHSAQLVVAEYQTRGRGRRGRSWFSPPCANLYMSMNWQFEAGLAGLGGLSLAVGIAVAEALASLGVPDLWLKWPNDIYRGTGKLGGILVDVSGEATGPCQAIIGVGLNVAMPASARLDRAWSDLSDQQHTDRNRIAAVLYIHIHRVLEEFSRHGFSHLLPRWQTLDGLKGRSIDLHRPGGPVPATATGVTADGGLLVRVDGEEQCVHADEVSVRVG